MNGEYWYVNWYAIILPINLFSILSPRLNFLSRWFLWNFYRNISRRTSMIEISPNVTFNQLFEIYTVIKIIFLSNLSFKPSRCSNLSSLDKMVLAKIIIIKFPNRNYLVSLVSKLAVNRHSRSRRYIPIEDTIFVPNYHANLSNALP